MQPDPGLRVAASNDQGRRDAEIDAGVAATTILVTSGRRAMQYRKPPSSRSTVDAAGRLLAQTDSSIPALAEARREARGVVDKWRAAHGYPLLAIRILLDGRTRKVNPEGLVAQRLKRLASVEAKIRRFPKMLVSRMNDLGGCRAILPTATDVEELLAVYDKQRQGHELIRKYDYIVEPKPSGYRSVHLVYRYRSREGRNAAWNGLRVEVQIRSRLQHAWATAVETVDALTGTELKISGSRNGNWDRFFQLMGSVLAIEEGQQVVPGTPLALAELRDEVRVLFDRLDVFGTLFRLGPAVQKVAGMVPGAGWFLLTLDANTRQVLIRPYPKGAFELAQQEYLKREEEFENRPGIQACLVSTESAQFLSRAFPNYFLDVGTFAESLRLFLGLPEQTPE